MKIENAATHKKNTQNRGIGIRPVQDKSTATGYCFRRTSFRGWPEDGRGGEGRPERHPGPRARNSVRQERRSSSRRFTSTASIRRLMVPHGARHARTSHTPPPPRGLGHSVVWGSVLDASNYLPHRDALSRVTFDWKKFSWHLTKKPPAC